MTRRFLPVLALLLVLGTVALLAESRTKSYSYLAPDRGGRVVVVPVGKEAGRSDYESRVEFRSGDDHLLCALDYSSEDAEHGFGVVKAEWTADSQYFVFSLTSSGGHQAWHAPTQFYSRREGIVRSLDDYFESGITSAHFRLLAPNTVKTEIRDDKSASLKLDTLPTLRSWRQAKPFIVECKGGRSIKVDQP